MSNPEKPFRRPQATELARRLAEPRRFIQVVAGARQVGKTTLVQQVTEAATVPVRYASADEPTLRGAEWIPQQWEAARLTADSGGAILVLDEVQKAVNWSEAVKRLWDEDTRARHPLKVVLLGSAPLLVQRGLTESLAGRFEVLHLPHWSFTEMRAAFGFSLEEYVYFGGYPGAASLVGEPARWRRYILDALIETTIARDVLLLTRVDKPVLLRRLFELGCRYSGRAVRQRGSSPKLQVLNTALMSAQSGLSLDEARADREFWGRLVESAVGAHLANAAAIGECELFYWREGNQEVDFVVRVGRTLTAIEVKSGRSRDTPPGLTAFAEAFKPARKLLVGGDGIPVEAF